MRIPASTKPGGYPNDENIRLKEVGAGGIRSRFDKTANICDPELDKRTVGVSAWTPLKRRACAGMHRRQPESQGGLLRPQGRLRIDVLVTDSPMLSGSIIGKTGGRVVTEKNLSVQDSSFSVLKFKRRSLYLKKEKSCSAGIAPTPISPSLSSILYPASVRCSDKGPRFPGRLLYA